MPYSISALRADLYRLIDRVLETGVPLEVERRGAMLKIVPSARRGRLIGLRAADGYFAADPGSLVHTDWSNEWRG
ncbi:MAG: type II toxin-antitoxin system Phd/YefM family antitoxin [Gemmatimonadota bacterium]